MQRACALAAAIGNAEECPRAWCPFWEHGGAVVQPGCAIERLGIDLSNPDLAHYLIDLRRALEGAHNEREAEAARSELEALVPPDLSGA
jgi:hypothetical protein